MCEYWYHGCGHETKTACTRTKKSETTNSDTDKNENDGDVEKFTTCCPGFLANPKVSSDPCYECIMTEVYQQVRVEKPEVEAKKAQLRSGKIGRTFSHHSTGNYSNRPVTQMLPHDFEIGSSHPPNNFGGNRAQFLTNSTGVGEFRSFDAENHADRSTSEPSASAQTETYDGIPLISTKSNGASPNRAGNGTVGVRSNTVNLSLAGGKLELSQNILGQQSSKREEKSDPQMDDLQQKMAQQSITGIESTNHITSPYQSSPSNQKSQTKTIHTQNNVLTRARAMTSDYPASGNYDSQGAAYADTAMSAFNQSQDPMSAALFSHQHNSPYAAGAVHAFPSFPTFQGGTVPSTPALGMVHPGNSFNYSNIYGPSMNLGNGSFQPGGYAGYGVGMVGSGGGVVGHEQVVWPTSDPFQDRRGAAPQVYHGNVQGNAYGYGYAPNQGQGQGQGYGHGHSRRAGRRY